MCTGCPSTLRLTCQVSNASSDQPYTAVRARSPKKPRQVGTGVARRGGCGGMNGSGMLELLAADPDDPDQVLRRPKLPHRGFEAGSALEVTGGDGALLDDCACLR